MQQFKLMIRKPSGRKEQIKFMAQDKEKAKEIALQIKAGEKKWG
jgi:general stress protein YciG